MTTVDNGVNVQALLDAREALKGAPEAAQFTWRASSRNSGGTFKLQAIVKSPCNTNQIICMPFRRWLESGGNWETSRTY